MNKAPVITAFASISPGKARLNGESWLEEADKDFNSFSRSLYKKLALQYPKFFKMDNPSKLALLTSEMIWLTQDIRLNLDASQIAIVLANKASSLDTDRIFNESIRDEANWFPSPAVFVYTLPNIMIGEISIKKNITGENAFFIFDDFDPVTLVDHVSEMLEHNRASACLCGWCDVDEGNFESFFMLVEKAGLSKDQLEFTVDSIVEIYKQK